MKKKLLAVLFLYCTYQNVFASNWFVFKKNNNSIFSIDLESLEVDLNKDKAKAWVRDVSKIVKPKPNESVQRKYYFEVECKPRILKVISFVSYNSKNQVINNYDPIVPKVINVAPDTFGGNVYHAVCIELMSKMKEKPVFKFEMAINEAEQCLKRNVDSNKYRIFNKTQLKDAAIENCEFQFNKAYETGIDYFNSEKEIKMTEENTGLAKLTIFSMLEESLEGYIK